MSESRIRETDETQGSKETSSKGAIIWVADDEEPVRNLVPRFLRKRIGAEEVETFADGQELLDAYDKALAGEENLPDLILSDLRMPRMGGEKLLEHIKEKAKRLPVFIIMSGNPTEEEIKRLKEMGARSVLRKPFGDFQTDLIDPLKAALENQPQ